MKEKINTETIRKFIEEVKKIKVYPPNRCFLTYCKLADRLYFRLEGPKEKGKPYITYYFATGDRKGWNLSAEKYVNVISKYLKRYGLNVVRKKIPYHKIIEHKKRLSKTEAESFLRIFDEMSEENNHG